MKIIVGDNAVKLTKEQLDMFSALTKLQKGIALNSMEGMEPIDAYRAAGGKAKTDNAASVSVSQILNNLNVKAFMDSFNEAMISDAIMTRTEMLERLTAISRTELTDVVTIRNRVMVEDGEGVEVEQSFWALKDPEDMTEGSTSAISELSAGKDGLKIKLHDQKAAMKQIAELEGFNAAIRLAHGGDPDAPPIAVENVPADPLEAAKVYQQMLEGK